MPVSNQVIRRAKISATQYIPHFTAELIHKCVADLTKIVENTDRRRAAVTDQELYFDRRDMELVHTMLRREFGHLPRLIREATNVERAGIIAGHFAVITDTLHHHHGAEDDFVWPLLKKRAGNSIEKHLQIMEAQHGELASRIERLSAGIRGWSADDATPNSPGPASDAGRLVELLDEHLAAEEALVVPFMEQHITADEWDEMVKQGAAAVEPAALPLGFGMVMYEGDFEAVERALGNLPADARQAVRSLAADSFAQHAWRVYGTTTPLRSTEL